MVIVAETAGFCFGVQRAVEMAENTLKDADCPVYSLGQLVHNDTVIHELEELGLRVVDSFEDLLGLPRGIVLIRAHGIPQETEEKLTNEGFRVVDATCPRVKHIQRIVKERSELGDTIVIAGDPEHPEVKSIVGRAKGRCFVVPEPEDFLKLELSKEERFTVVAQTTYSVKKFQKLLAIFHDFCYSPFIADTMCKATRERQEEARKIAIESDVMIVIGSPRSSNSQKLRDVSNEYCSHTYFIQTADGLKPEWFFDAKTVGITAGASTPKKILTEVQIACQNLNKC
jgi:4-hydroxy-3-methylbut-2-enyl diphosphate reductase